MYGEYWVVPSNSWAVSLTGSLAWSGESPGSRPRMWSWRGPNNIHGDLWKSLLGSGFISESRYVAQSI